MEKEIGSYSITEEANIVEVRNIVKILATEMGFNNIDTIRITTATSELTRNIYEYASKGEVSFFIVKEDNYEGFKLTFKDEGPGIKNLEKVLNTKRKRKGTKGLGLGLVGAKNLMDEFEIKTDETGTSIKLIKWLQPPHKSIITEIRKYRMILAKHSEESALDIMETQNKEALIILEELKEKNTQLEATNLELEGKNEELKYLMQDVKNTKEKIADTLDQFAFIAAHDLREPLRSVVSFTQLLKKKYSSDLESKANDYMNYVIDGAMKMKSLLDDLLAYSEIGSYKKPFENFDANKIVKSVLSDLKIIIEKNKAKVEVKDLPEIKADKSEIKKVFHHLILNAIKYSGEKDPEIHISATDKENKWRFSIQDNGIGIDEKFHERIFLIFQRLNKKGDISGTGIGLAICKKVIDYHKGEIWVESEPDQGSTFYFTIPK
jgi:signal transduction histidine kinase